MACGAPRYRWEHTPHGTRDAGPCREYGMRVRGTRSGAGYHRTIAPDFCDCICRDPEELPRPVGRECPEFQCRDRTLRHHAELADHRTAQVQDILWLTHVRTGTPDLHEPCAEQREDHKVKRQPGILRYFPHPAPALRHPDRFLHRFYRWPSAGHAASPPERWNGRRFGFRFLKSSWIIAIMKGGSNRYLRKP